MRWTSHLDAAVMCGLVVASITILGCTSPPPLPMPVVDTAIPECPHDWNKIVIYPVDSVGGPAAATTLDFTATGLSVPRVITNVPEFNDCQMLMGGDRTYKTLTAIFASQDLGNLSFSQQGQVVPAVAEILSFARTPDGNALGIGPLFNCLYLWRVGLNGKLVARMVRVGGAESRCGERYDTAKPAQPGETDLAVTQTVPTGFTNPNDYPPVARWDLDSTQTVQSIGLRCETGWCEIGPKKGSDFVPSPSYINATASGGPATPYALPTTPEDRVRAIKGWYDEQYLMAQDRTKPSVVKGTVFPEPTTTGTVLSLQAYGRWRRTGYVALEAPAGAEGAAALKYYKDKFNLDPVHRQSPLAVMNKLDLCYGTIRGCIGFPYLNVVKKSCGAAALAASVSSPRWWVRITATDGGVMYRCVIRRPDDILPMAGMTAAMMPHTARWRWLMSDETIWDECRTGCCQVAGDF